MRFTNFCASCTGKVLTTIFTLILGMVLALGGIVLTGYVLLSKEGMVGTIEEAAQERGLPIDFSESLEELSLLEWGVQVFELLGSINTATVGQIEETTGYTDLSKLIEEALGISVDKIRESTLGSLGETISDNLTLALAGEKFNVTFPDLPVFRNEEFMNKSLKDAFADFDDLELQDFVEVTEESSVLLLNLADLKVGDMSNPEGGLDDRINSMQLGEVIEITESSHNVLIKLKDTKVGELGSSGTDGKINSMMLGELMDIKDPSEEGGSTKVLWALRNSPLVTRDARYGVGDPIIDENGDWVTDGEGTPLYYESGTEIPDGVGGTRLTEEGEIVLDAGFDIVKILGVNDRIKVLSLNEIVNTGSAHIWNYLGAATIENLGVMVDEMCIHHAVEITAASNGILRKMRVYNPDIDEPEDAGKFGTEDLKISDMNTKLIPIVQSVELGEVITINESSAPILKALKNTQIGDMNAKINTLTVKDTFNESQYSTGVLSLVDAENTLLTELPAELTSEIKTSRMERLGKSGLVSALPPVNNDDIEIVTYFRNQTIATMMADYISGLKGNPFGIPRRVYLEAGDSEITPEFIDGLAGFFEGASLVLSENTTIKTGAYTKIFNIMLNGFDLLIEEGVTFSSENELGGKTIYPGGLMFITDIGFDAVPLLYDAVAQGGEVTVEYLIEDDENPGEFLTVTETMTEANANDFGLVNDLSVASAEITFIFKESD